MELSLLPPPHRPNLVFMFCIRESKSCDKNSNEILISGPGFADSSQNSFQRGFTDREVRNLFRCYCCLPVTNIKTAREREKNVLRKQLETHGKNPSHAHVIHIFPPFHVRHDL
jgi:hypothetical protein